MFSFTTSSQLTTYTQQRVSKRDDEMSSSFSSSSDANETHNNTTTKKVYRHVDVVSFADLCLEADVILESSLNSNSGAASARFHQNHFPEKIKKTKKSESGHRATENTRPKEVVVFPRSMTKRLKSAFALFSSSSLNEMNSNEWLDLLRRSNLLSNGFSDARARRCFENIIFAGDFTPDDEDEDEDENNDDERRRRRRRRRASSINFDQFLHLLARKVAKAYDVEAKVVGKRVVATAYAIERRREEEAQKEEEEEGESDDDDDSDGYREYDGYENNVFSNRRRAMTTMPPPATTHHTTAAAASSLGVSSWRVRAAEYTNRYRNSNNNDINFARALIGYQNNEADEDAKIEDILLEDRVANAFETTFCQSSSKTTRTPPTTINEREFVKICAACAFIGNGFTASNCSDLAFAVGRERRRQRRRGRKGEEDQEEEEEERLTGVEIDARAFLVGLREIASVHDVSFADVAERVLRLLSSNSSSSSRRRGGQSTKISWG